MNIASHFPRLILVPFLLGIATPPTWAEAPAIAAKLQPFVDSHTLAGAVTLVATPEKVLSLEAVGYSDVAAKTPMKVDDLFWIASMNKAMTAAGLMVLVDEGKVKLDDPVEKYLPEFRDQMVVAEKDTRLVVLKKPTHPVTVRNLLSHTAGLVGRSPLETTLDSISLKDASITYGLSPLKFDPGTKYEYCNPGINTVGRLIEVISGMPYETFLQKRLFDPLGMTDTTFWPNEAQAKRVAKSYRPNQAKNDLEAIEIDQLRYPLTDKSRHAYPAGGLFSTATDVATFCRMILNGGTLDGKRILSESSVRAMTSTQTGDLLNGDKGENGYGLGFSTSRKARPDAIIPGPCGHGGAYSTNMSIDPEKKLVTVFMVQHAGYPNDGGKAVYPAFEKAVRASIGK
jgi:CubicO group peptidase (beta-lactamase class C family)